MDVVECEAEEAVGEVRVQAHSMPSPQCGQLLEGELARLARMFDVHAPTGSGSPLTRDLFGVAAGYGRLSL
ncbi:hypothetical protein ACN6LA_001632 [Streptomyces sp. SAS_269]|uniref:hypothetical protein n=1 Tax=Streptomyces sp. SAS_269 TaxID=3412749 RepID=UPI00403C2262